MAIGTGSGPVVPLVASAADRMSPLSGARPGGRQRSQRSGVPRPTDGAGAGSAVDQTL